ncbi:MAG: GTPase [Candidatus Aenigmatarchaeota archaeon]|nr:50S ribosome-binding GTPase [Candidatus Aenigmarchaeota archaeon]
MKKYWKIVEEVINQVDVVLEIVDARMPELTRNKKIESMVFAKRKRLIVVCNKADLINQNNFSKDKRFVYVSTKKRFGFAKLRKTIMGNKEVVRVGVVGYPNTGKSSVINSLVGRKKALTSSVAGFTKGVQWITDHKGLLLYDTPGVIPFDENDEIKKAIMCVLSPSQIKDPYLVALKIIEIFLNENKSALETKYNIKASNDAEDVLLEIGKKMNYLVKNGEIDVTRTCIKIIKDWQQGLLFLNA